MKNNKSGFSLVELMVVVSIIAILAAIAVPNFSKMAARSKQSAAKIELAGIYTAEQAFFAEYSTYHSNLPYIGYVPEGYTVAASCPGATSEAKRYYTAGFGAESLITSAMSTNGAILVAPGAPPIICSGRMLFASNMGAPAGLEGGANVSTATVFLAQASGNIGTNAASSDKWTVNQVKAIANTTNGI